MSLDKKFYVNVGPGGTFKPSGSSQFDTTPADIDSMVNYLRQNNKRHLVLYFHGGLVNERSAMATATRISHLVSSTTDVHPLFFVWETGLLETLRDDLSNIHKLPLFKKLLEKVIKIAGKKLGLDIPTDGVASRSIGGLKDHEIQRQLSMLVPFENVTTVTSGTRALGVPDTSTIEEEVSNELSRDPSMVSMTRNMTQEELALLGVQADSTGARSFGGLALIKILAKVIIKVIGRMIKGRDHGFYPTVIEEILREVYVSSTGAAIWKRMKDKAEAMWQPDSAGTGGVDQHAGTYLLSALEKYGETGKVTIDLVGHSAGSIVIAHLLKSVKPADDSQLQIRNVIFMAPACTCELFATNVLKNSSRFSAFRMFTMSDYFETRNWMLSVVYPRSLLYFISGALEDDGKAYDEYILGLERHGTGTAPYDTQVLKDIRAFMHASPDRFSWAVSPEGTALGMITGATKHGGFDDEGEPTLSSIVHILNQP